MMGTKLNPGTYDCYDKIAPDEPFFVLRAKDPLAAGLVREWVQRASMFGTHELDKLSEAARCASDMDAWRDEARREEITDRDRINDLEGTFKLFPGTVITRDEKTGMFKITCPERGDVTAMALRACMDKAPKDEIPF